MELGNILVVEDDRANRELLEAALRRRGWRVESAEEGNRALQLWREGRFDLVLTDMRLPGKSGLEVTRTIRSEEPAGTRTPIIAVTAYCQAKERMEYFLGGIDEYLPKPLRIATLYALVERYMLLSSSKRMYCSEN